MACYDNIIGLSRADCPCIDTAPDPGYNTSNSGLFITDLEPLDDLKGYSECGAGSIWEILGNVRDEAIRVFKSDTNALLAQYFTTRRERFSGQIGEASGRDILNTSNTYAGMMIGCNPMRGGLLRINAIGTIFSAPGNISLSIYNSLNELVVSPFSVETLNGWKLNTLDTPIELPIYIDFDSKHEYFLVYEVNPANPAKLNNISCGCGGFMPYYDREKPMWGKQYSGANGWANWVMVSGWEGDSLTDFDITGQSKTNRLNGLALSVEFGCDVSEVLCKGTPDFTNDLLAMSQAYAILWKSGELLASKLLSATSLNRSNVIKREILKQVRRDWNERYVEATRYIAEQAATGQNDCLACREDRMIGVKTALL